MKTWTAAATLAMVMWSAAAASAEDAPTSGNYWFQKCSGTESNDRLSCLSFVFGLDTGISTQASITQSSVVYCPPDGVTMGQKVDIFKKYLTEHPETRNQMAALHYVMGMAEAYPCKGAKPPVR